MSQKSPLQEGKEYLFALKNQKPFIFWSIIISIAIFFVPIINLLLPFYWGILLAYKIFLRTKKSLNVFLSLFVSGVLFVGVVFFSNIPVLAYNISVLGGSNTSNNTNKNGEQKLSSSKSSQLVDIDIQKQKENLDKELLDKEAKEKSQAEEKAKAESESESEKNIATKINLDYDVESSLESQDLETAKQANLAIASLGTNTKDQKLFDVISIVDGDTVKVSELGTLRLIGIDTPETKDPRKPVQCFGVEASNKAKQDLEGKRVYLEFDPANRIDKYGRTLAYLYREDGYFFNAEMIKQGFANSYTKFPHPKLDEFNRLESEARDNQRGLYSPNTCSGNTNQPANTQKSSQSIKNTQQPISEKAVEMPVNQEKPVQPASSPIEETLMNVIKKSNNNICHEPGSTYYNKTKNFQAYNTLEECLASGGRLPKN